MTRFRFQAADPSGQIESGWLDAASAAEARDVLRMRALLPLSVVETRTPLLAQLSGLRATGQTLRPGEIALFTRQLATLISSGVPVEAALDAVARQTGARLAKVCSCLRTAILDGHSLSAALEEHGAGIDHFYRTTVQAGERAGQLGPVLTHLATYVEARLQNRQSITLALIYPAILILVSLAVVSALLVFVLPDIVRVFASRGADLPPLTRLMIGLSDGLSRFAPLIALVLATAGIGVGVILRKKSVQIMLHRAFWHIGLARQATSVQFAGTLATLTQSGVTLAEALPSAAATVGNLDAQIRLRQVAQAVRDGSPLSAALANQTGFPPMMITMISSGEASGTLPAMLARFADDQSRLLQARVKTLVGLVEPLVLLLMGGVVMLLVLAILLPIIQLNSLVG
jgi:general secretion pathway protein F